MRVPSTSGVQLELHDLGGDDAGAPLLLCHATGFCARTYEPLAARLRAAGDVHVWAVDFRGHGDSSPPADGNFDWRGMGEDVLAAVDAIGAPSAVHGFGHSMGGAALLIAELARPGTLRTAFLYEPIVMPAAVAAARAAGPNPMAEGSRRRRSTFASRGDALLRYATRPGLDRLRADALAAYVQHGFRDADADAADGSIVLKCAPEHEALTFEAPKVNVEEVAGIPVPSIVALGRRDAEGMPAAVAPHVARALTNAELVEYAHLGHFGPLQDPDTIADGVLALTAR